MHRKELYSKEAYELYLRIVTEIFSQTKIEFVDGIDNMDIGSTKGN